MFPLHHGNTKLNLGEIVHRIVVVIFVEAAPSDWLKKQKCVSQFNHDETC